MKKLHLLLLLGCLLCLFALPAAAQELLSISISCTTDQPLSAEEAAAAQVTLTQNGQETVMDAQLRLHGNSLDMVEAALPQKSMHVDSDHMRFLLYNDGNDALGTKVMSAVCSQLIAQGPLPVAVRAQEPVEVRLNGEYQGLYTRRECIVDAIARFEGLPDTAALNVADAARQTVHGDASGLTEVFRRIQALDLSQEKDRKILSELLDTESFLNWLAVNAYVGTADLYGEIFFYQVDQGPWKCAAGDFAYAFLTAGDDSIARITGQNAVRLGDTAALASRMLAEPVYRDAFLTKMGTLYQALPTEVMQAAVDAENARIATALPAHAERWSEVFVQTLDDPRGFPADKQEAVLFQRYRVERLRNKTLPQRPWYVYDSIQRGLQVSDEDMARYFGSARPELPDVPGDTWEEYKAAHS